ncbi:Rz1-like lysis system protein LysC [Limnobaculum xujianqingii]|uniref:Rz1-like lysis system protein LysC n=1 Tax=Limnobaculum xujianqingii TaxID=2738837 RepID=UPI001E330FB3|nr:hypothetical protein [Limnobaculum xujianqingii]
MQNSRSHWSHREPRTISKWLLRVMIVLTVIFLMMLLNGCGSTRIVYVTAPAVPLPANLTDETPQPPIPVRMNWGNSLNLNIAALSALAQCNADKASIRDIQHQQQREKDE